MNWGPKGAIHIVPPGLFLTDLGRLWSDFFETFRKWTLTLMTKVHGVRFAKKFPRGQLGCPESSQKVPENAKISFLS